LKLLFARIFCTSWDCDALARTAATTSASNPAPKYHAVAQQGLGDQDHRAVAQRGRPPFTFCAGACFLFHGYRPENAMEVPLPELSLNCADEEDWQSLPTVLIVRAIHKPAERFQMPTTQR
jgi:hypothetical protein